MLEPWAQDPGLAPKTSPMIPTIRAPHCRHVQDNEKFDVKEMAATAFAFETMIAQSTVTKLERDGTLVKRSPAVSKVSTSKAKVNAVDADQVAAQMGLPNKAFPSGKTYSACVACHVVSGKTAYHAPAHRPVRKAHSGDGKAD